MKLLFKNARLLRNTQDETLDCVVTDSAITYIGTTPPEEMYDRIIECKGNLLMPAFYNAHCHAAMTLFRGYGEDLPLRRWLDEKILPAEENLNFRRV